LSQGELEGVRETFIDRLFAGEAFRVASVGPSEPAIGDRVVRGGFPEVVARAAGRRRAAWFGSYLTAILQRDVRDLARIEGLTEMPHLLALLAARTSGLLNMSELSRSAGIPHTTMKRYLALLQTTFLVQLVPAWSANLGKRLVKSAKLLLCDTGLAAHLTGTESGGLETDRSRFGPLLENFVGIELLKMASWSDRDVKLYHYRTSSGREIGFLAEDRGGRVAAVEVKASATVKADDFSAIRSLADALGPRLVSGVVLYTGTQVMPFGDRLTAVPVSMLWTGSGAAPPTHEPLNGEPEIP
jgi:predicted AAA+ superfamily ATPase